MYGQPVRSRPPGPRHAQRGRHGRRVRGQGATGQRTTAAPVFVDVTGRRRRIVRRAVIAAGLMITVYLGVVGVGLLAGSAAPLTPWPGRAHHGQDAGPSGPASGPAHGTPPARAAEPSPRPGTLRPVTASAPATAATTTAAPPTAIVSHPGNSHATPRGFGRTRAPNPKKT